MNSKVTKARHKTRNAPNKLSEALFTALTSFVIAFYFELFREAVNFYRYGDAIGLMSFSFTTSSLVCIAGVFIVSFALLMVLRRQRRILSFLFKWRFLFALGLFVILVVLQISGSSIGFWDYLLNNAPNAETEGVLYGVPRAIRSDEYIVFTPMALSQEYVGYDSISNIVRNVDTNLTMVYAQPCWALATLFRPFFWGYLISGSAYGLSFFWCGRVIALLVVSFEFGRFITHDNRCAALAYALILSLSPIVQWWFSVNGTAELLIFAQGGVLAFSAFLRAPTLLRRIASASLASYAAGCFILIIYPAWQVTVGYVIVALCIADIIRCRNENVGALEKGVGFRKAFVSYWLVLLCTLAVLAIFIAIILLSSMDVIRAVSNTAYPGHRVETGGGLAPLLFDWAISWLYPIECGTIVPNVCERASMFSLFPLGILLSLPVLRRERDPYLISLLIVEVLLLAFGIVGFPAWLAKLTLLSNALTSRIPFALGFIDIILLFRAISLLNESGWQSQSTRISTPIIVAISLVFGIGSAILVMLLSPTVAFKVFLGLSALLASLAAYAALSFATGRSDSFNLACVALVIAFAGLCVNPVQQGVDVLKDDELLKEVTSLAAEDPEATWAGDNNVASQALIASGAPTVTSVAVYPDLNTWRKIDPTGENEEIYNRYAHITMEVTEGDTEFAITSPDAFTVKVNENDIANLGIDYWLSKNDLTAHNSAGMSFVPLDSNGIWTIYKVSRQ